MTHIDSQTAKIYLDSLADALDRAQVCAALAIEALDSLTTDDTEAVATLREQSESLRRMLSAFEAEAAQTGGAMN